MTSGARLTGGEALVAALAAHDVTTVFGIPGTHNLAVYAHLGRYGIQHFSPRHEQGAGYAADGYARSTGRVGVCLTTTGPAILNAAAAAAQAWSDSVPVLFLSPGMPLQHPALGNGLLHEVKDQGRAMASVLAYSHRVTSVGEVPLAVAQAFAAMRDGRPRPVHLEIPVDLLDTVADARVLSPVPRTQRHAEPAVLDQAAAVVGGALQPGIVVGGGARNAVAEVTALAERLGAPVLHTTNGKGTVADGHPLALGTGVHHRAASDLTAECDVVLAIGTELAPSDLWLGPLPVPGTLVRIDVDPAQVLTNAVPDVPLVGDAALVVSGLLERLERVEPQPAAAEGVARAEVWRGRIRDEAQAEGQRYLPIIESMAAVLGPGDVVAADSAMACYYGALSNLPCYRPGSFLYPTGMGTLGFGLPAAIGAQLAAPQARVMAMHGDGGLMFTVAELAGAAEARLAIPVLVVDNGGYGEIRDEQLARGDRPTGVDLGRPDFVALARSLGCHGVALADPGELAGALESAFGAERPTLLHVHEPT